MTATGEEIGRQICDRFDLTRKYWIEVLGVRAEAAEREASVMELAAPFSMTQPAISKHIKVLERAGLVTRGRDAQRRPCRIEAQALAEANAWLEDYRQLWEVNFQRLDALLDELQAPRNAAAPPQPGKEKSR